jgi:hypothetical protein
VHVPDAADIVSAWERGLREGPIQRALTLCALACPADTRAQLTSLPIAERDRRLLRLHEQLFGGRLNSCAECPNCGTTVEFSLDPCVLRGEHDHSSAPLECAADDLLIRFRLPTSEDLEAVLDAPSVTELRRRLAERCIVETMRGDRRSPMCQVSDGIIAQLSTAMTRAGAQDTAVTVRCAECGHAWDLVIDIGAFLWAEVNLLARVLLRQVHALAWAYGWCEADVLNMSSARRDFYLKMVTQ